MFSLTVWNALLYLIHITVGIVFSNKVSLHARFYSRKKVCQQKFHLETNVIICLLLAVLVHAV